MFADLSQFVIQPIDVQQALTKWDGRCVILEGNKKTEQFWKATDREFFEGFSTGHLDESLLRRFAESNNNDVPKKRTGGYSIKRKFWGGLSAWAPRLQDFYRFRISPSRERYQRSGALESVWELTIELAKMEGQSSKGHTNGLGIVAASKLLFFACPEMPIFIYDSVVGIALKIDKLAIDDYPAWCHQCNDILNANSSAILLLPTNRQDEFQDKADWFTRRSIDLMLYRHGAKRSFTSQEVSCL